MPRPIFLARSSRRAGSFRQEKTKPRLGDTSRNSRLLDSSVYEIPRFLSGTMMCKVRDLRLGRDLVRVCSVDGVTSLKTQKYFSSRVRSCWKWVSSDTDKSDQSKCKRILEIRGQLCVSLLRSSWKLVTCRTREDSDSLGWLEQFIIIIFVSCLWRCYLWILRIINSQTLTKQLMSLLLKDNYELFQQIN